MTSYLDMSYDDWQMLNDSFLMTKSQGINNFSSNPIDYDESIFNDYDGNTCTDGKDDGKIGLLSAAGNVVEGAAKGFLKGIKGCFTNSEGNFSWKKTFGTLAMGAACIAFPAVGLAACAVGAVAGGTKLVKGVSTALSAETDAEAKAAWEAVGDGGATVIGCVAGVKGSLGAVKASSTAGLGAIDDTTKALGSMDDATSALSQLDDTATTWTKAKALGKDCLSSSKNNFKKAKSDLSTFKDGVKLSSRRSKAGKIDFSKKLSKHQQKSYDKWKNMEYDANTTDDVIKIADKISDIPDAVKNVAKKSVSNVGKKVSNGFQNLKSTDKAAFINNIKNLKNSANWSSIRSTLSTKAKPIYDFITTKEGTLAQASQRYGYENVLGVLETIYGYQLSNQTV